MEVPVILILMIASDQLARMVQLVSTKLIAIPVTAVLVTQANIATLSLTTVRYMIVQAILFQIIFAHLMGAATVSLADMYVIALLATLVNYAKNVRKY